MQAYEQIHPFLPAMGGIAAFAALAGLRGASLRAQAPAAAKLSLCFFGKVFAQKASRRRQGARLQTRAHTKRHGKIPCLFLFE